MVSNYRFYDFHDGPGYYRYTGDQKWRRNGWRIRRVNAPMTGQIVAQ